MDKLIGGVIYPYPVYFANITGVDLTNFERTEVQYSYQELNYGFLSMHTYDSCIMESEGEQFTVQP